MLSGEVTFFRSFLRRIYGVGFFKLGHMGLSVIAGAVIANILGPEEYGKYSFAMAAAMLALQPIQMAVNTLLIRETAALFAKHLVENIKGLFFVAGVLGLCSLCALPILGIVLGDFFLKDRSSYDSTIFFVASVLCPFLAVTQMPGAILQGFKRIQLGIALDFLMVSIWLCLLIYGVFLKSHLTATSIMVLHGVGALATLAAASFVVFALVPTAVWQSKMTIDLSLWKKSFPPLFMSTALLIVNSQLDIIMLGAFLGPSEVGSYRVASQLALLIGVPLIITNSLIAPYVSEFVSNKRLIDLHALLKNSTILNLVFCSLLFLTLILYLTDIVGTLYGEEFLTALVPCLILSVSQLVNVSFGPVQMLLNMSGRESVVARTMPYAIVINIIFNIVLIPWIGPAGAAVSSLISLSVWNFLLRRYIRQRLLVECSFFLLWPKFR